MDSDTLTLLFPGFSLKLGFKISIKGDLSTVEKILSENSVYKLISGDGKAFLGLRDEPQLKLLWIEAGKAVANGKAVEVQVDIGGSKRFLAFHYSYDPPDYFRKEVEPYNYPVKLDVDEDMLSPWTYPWHGEDLDKLPAKLKMSQILFEGEKGYLYVLPISGEGFVGYLTEPGKNSFRAVHNAWTQREWSKLGLLVFSFDQNPYKAVSKAYEAAFKFLGKEHALRRKKRLPEVFEYLGWCTWNAFWRDIDEKKIVEGFAKIREKVPITYLLIDDGWMKQREGALSDFEADPGKFPTGLKGVVDKIKKLGARYVGLWLTLNGYWKGIDKESVLAEKLSEDLAKIDDMLAPKPERAFHFYNKWFKILREAGMDFIKVDNQFVVGLAYAGHFAVEEASRMLHEGLEGAAYVNGLEVLNCMAMNPDHAFNWLRSAVSRNCVDYIVPHLKSRDRLHLYFNAYNALWMSQVVWPDWDMFQTHDPLAVPQAVARAVSGGPVYITDEPEKTVEKVASPLALRDGRLPRPAQPTLPCKDTLMLDPYNQKVPLKIFNHYYVEGAGNYGLVAVFNIYRGEEDLDYRVKPEDAELSGEYFYYEYFTGEHGIIRNGESIEGTLGPDEVRLYVLAPKLGEAYIVGTPQLYVMPGILGKIIRADNEYILLLRQKEEILVYPLKRMRADEEELEEETLAKVKPKKDTVILLLNP